MRYVCDRLGNCDAQRRRYTVSSKDPSVSINTSQRYQNAQNAVNAAHSSRFTALRISPNAYKRLRNPCELWR